jgi:hypothetical protein
MCEHINIYFKNFSIAFGTHATIDNQLCACDETRFIRSQKKYGIRGITPIAHKGHWNTCLSDFK